MKLIGLMGERASEEAERLWRHEAATVLPMDICIRRAAIELHGLSDAEAYGGEVFIERMGTCNTELFTRIADAIGRPEVHRRVAELLDVVRDADDLVVLLGLCDDDRAFVASHGGTLMKV